MVALNLKIIYRFLGITAVLNGLFMFIAFPFSYFNDESQANGILNAGIITVFIGLILFFFNKPKSTNIQKKEGYLIVTLGWLTLSFTGSYPIYYLVQFLILLMPFLKPFLDIQLQDPLS